MFDTIRWLVGASVLGAIAYVLIYHPELYHTPLP